MGQGPVREQSREYRDELRRICARNLLETTDEIIYFKDLQSRFIWLSGAWGAITGREPEELLGLTDFDIYGPEHAAAAYADEQEIIATGVPLVNKQERETWPGRADRWVTSTKIPLRDDEGRIIGTFGISRDITRLVETEAQATRNAQALEATLAELSRVETQLRTVLDTSADGIALYDAQGRYQYVNAATERMSQGFGKDLLGRTDREIGWPEEFLAVWEPALARVLATGEAATVEFESGSGSTWRGFQSRLAVHSEVDGTPTGVVASTREVTELRRTQDKLAHQAVHDPVTGLANRVVLMDRLTQSLRRMVRHPGQIALLFIDIDRFKEVNDTYGHGAGDRLLIEVGQRLAALTRPGDTVARFGGDEFVLLCDDLALDEDVQGIADRTVISLGAPFTEDGHDLYVTASVGVVVTSDPYAVPEDLVRDADAAMYQAKEHGRNRFQFFDAVLRDRAAERYAMETELSRALERDQFRLEYQPVFALDGRRLVGAEALIRWDHPTLGSVSPVDFIHIAENRGLIVPIGTWVLHEACRQMVEWSARRDPALPPLTIAVNVSGRQLRASDFAAVVIDAVGRHGLPPGQLCLEITETALLVEAADARETIQELSDLGIRIALDDFGTGYSSLAHLLELPVDILKIDKSFVDQVENNNHRGREIVAAVIAMAHVFGMRVVGEGIETAGQLEQLGALGCDDGQGFLLARPLRPQAWAGLTRPQAQAQPDPRAQPDPQAQPDPRAQPDPQARASMARR